MLLQGVPEVGRQTSEGHSKGQNKYVDPTSRTVFHVPVYDFFKSLVSQTLLKIKSRILNFSMNHDLYNVHIDIHG